MNDDEVKALAATVEGQAMLNMRVTVELRAVDVINIRSSIQADLTFPERFPPDLLRQLKELDVVMEEAMAKLEERH